MKLIVATLVLMTTLWSTQAMDSSDDSEDPEDIYVLAPEVNLTGSAITKSKQENSIVFETLLADGNQIIVQQHTCAQSTHKYVGEHLFTSQKGLQLGDDLSPKHAQKLFDECANLYAQQETKKDSSVKQKTSRLTVLYSKPAYPFLMPHN